MQSDALLCDLLLDPLFLLCGQAGYYACGFVAFLKKEQVPLLLGGRGHQIEHETVVNGVDLQ